MALVPEWFTTAIATPPEVSTVPVDGIDIRCLAWGDPDAPAVVLLHGGGAHAQWWDHLAPLLAEDYRVVALDLSGHGHSGRRPKYSLTSWAAEVMAVIAQLGLRPHPTLIGHSMGGLVALNAAHDFGSELSGTMAIDSPIRVVSPEERAAHEQRAFGPLKSYRSREEILARWRPVPDQPVLGYIGEYVAQASIQEVDGAWTWQFDPAIFHRDVHAGSVALETGPPMACRVGLFRAERGLITADMGEIMYHTMGRRAPLIVIPDSGHAVMLDQPLALLTGLRTLLADWGHSTPQRPTD